MIVWVVIVTEMVMMIIIIMTEVIMNILFDNGDCDNDYEDDGLDDFDDYDNDHGRDRLL